MEAYRGNIRITTRDLINSYHYSLNSISQHDAIIQRLETLPVGAVHGLKSTGEHLLALTDDMDEEQRQKSVFLVKAVTSQSRPQIHW